MLPDEFDKVIRELAQSRRIEKIRVVGSLRSDYFIDDFGKKIYISNFMFDRLIFFYTSMVGGGNPEPSEITSIYGIPLVR